jgi:cellular nucleic acid-binding protein
MDRRIRSDRFSYRGAPYRRESRRGYRFLFSFFSVLCALQVA